jgi:uncharacterized membrane protein
MLELIEIIKIIVTVILYLLGYAIILLGVTVLFLYAHKRK